MLKQADCPYSTLRDRTASGLTIIELLVVMSIVAVMGSYAAPAFNQWVQVFKMDADLRQLAGMVHATRLSAIRLNTRVIMCPGDNRGCQQRNAWHRGTIVFADRNNNRRIDGEEVLLAHLPALYSNATWRSFRNRSYLSFLPSAFTDWQNGHFQLCLPDAAATLNRMLVLNYSGRLYRSNDSDGDGIHEDAAGDPLQC